jgi:hypothetical protein
MPYRVHPNEVVTEGFLRARVTTPLTLLAPAWTEFKLEAKELPVAFSQGFALIAFLEASRLHRPAPAWSKGTLEPTRNPYSSEGRLALVFPHLPPPHSGEDRGQA